MTSFALAASLDVRHVVTSFITRSNQILLLQRSQKVRSYRDKWASVSGTVEQGESLWEAALREIKEETQVGEADLSFKRKGRPVIVRDKKEEKGTGEDQGEPDRTWVIHPWLFEVQEDQAINTDWEHDQFCWVNPSKLFDGSYDTVPRLGEALDKVLLPSAAEKGLGFLARDRTHGASELARISLGIMGEAMDEILMSEHVAGDAVQSSGEATRLYQQMREVAWHIITVRSSMRACIGAAVLRFLERMEKRDHATSGAGVAKACCEELDAAMEQLITGSSARITESVMNRASKRATTATIMSLSYSSSVKGVLIKVLKELASKGTQVNLIVSESRPLNEGLTLASKIHQEPGLSGITLTVITEAQIGVFMEHCDALVLGADSITKDGAATNKVGSYLAALAAKDKGVEVFVVALLDKMLVPLPADEFAYGEEDTEQDEGEENEAKAKHHLSIDLLSQVCMGS
ncbi:unnamed protein product [Chrysoparadoxa australica]